ncbi:MAG: LamG-like jellyroll fold domain-containing protein [Dehalobacterium sp.]
MATNAGGSRVESVGTINTEGWQHVVLSVDSSTKIVTIYLDGEKDSTFTATDFANEPAAGFRVGHHKAYDQLPFNGLVDQVKIYNRVLSDAEAQALFTDEVPAEVAKDRFVAALNQAENGYSLAGQMREYVAPEDFPVQLYDELKAFIDEAKSIDLDAADITAIIAATDRLIAKTRELDAAINLLNIVSIDIDVNNIVNRVNKELYGVNHRYEKNGYGMWDAENQQADPKFNELYKEVGFGSMRYPGGTIGNLFDWKRSIGPVEERKLTIHGHPANAPIEPNFGLDEAARFAEQAGSTLVYMYGIGNGSAPDAADLVEYLNAAADGETTNPNGGIDWAEVRAENGHPAPYNIFNFEIGNEVYVANQQYWIAGSGTGNYQSKYANGGEFSFTKQEVVMDEDWRPDTSLSDGTANQEKYIRYVPLKQGTVEVFVNDQKWNLVDSLEGQGSANVYTLDYTSGKITFGNGTNGNIPAAGTKITASYTCIKDGFKAYVTTMKAVDPRVKVYSCLHDDPFFTAMGNFKYDGVAIHPYGGINGQPNMEAYHDNNMTSAQNQVNAVRNMINKVKSINPEMNVIATEYSILGLSAQYREYLNSTGRALYVAKTLIGYSQLEMPYANNQSLIDVVGSRSSVSVGEMGVIQHYVDENDEFVDFVLSPVTLPMEMFSKYFDRNILETSVANNPGMNGNPAVGKLDVLSSKDDNGNVYLMVANTDRLDDVSAVISFDGLEVNDAAKVITMVSPDYNSQNTPDNPDNVKLVESSITGLEGKTGLGYIFPKHSVVSIMFTPKDGNAVTVMLDEIADKKPGDAVTISGTTNLAEVTLKVLRPNQTILYLNVLTGGSFTDNFTLPEDTMEGIYTVVVGQGLTVATESFEVKRSREVNKTDLAAKIAEIGLLQESDYTAESWAALQTALQEAITVNANPDAIQQEVDTALAGLASAIAGLVEKEPPVEVRVTDIKLEPSQVNMHVGKTKTLKAKVLPRDATNKDVTWVTSNDNIAIVVDGVVTAKAVGTATITVTTVDGGKSAQCTVNVTR